MLPPDTSVFGDPDALAGAAADRLVAAVATAPTERVAICLSGGSTPKRLYELLAASPRRDMLAWERVHWFWGDERCVAPDDADSNYRLARNAMLAHAPVPSDNVHRIAGEAGWDRAAASYGSELKGFYGAETLEPDRPLFSLVLLGLGQDGHTASLFPDRHEVDEQDAWAVGIPEASLEPFVPRVSLTIPVLSSARTVLFLAAGASKQVRLDEVARGHDLPPNRIRAQGERLWYVDRAAVGPE